MLGLVTAIGGCLLLGIIATAWFKTKTTRLARSRQHVGLPQFLTHFSQKGIPTDVATAVYEYLSNLPWMHEFPVDPSDSLNRVYGISGEELVDTYGSIITPLGRNLPDYRKDDAFRVETVDELVQFVAELPRK